LRTLNNQIACKPLENTAVKSKQIGSLKVGDFGGGGTLIPLTTVVSFSGMIKDVWLSLDTSSVVYVKADCIAQPWVKGIYTCDDVKTTDNIPQKFILVPADQIIMVEPYFPPPMPKIKPEDLA
jgi:hypothetical protein